MKYIILKNTINGLIIFDGKFNKNNKFSTKENKRSAQQYYKIPWVELSRVRNFYGEADWYIRPIGDNFGLQIKTTDNKRR